MWDLQHAKVRAILAEENSLDEWGRFGIVGWHAGEVRRMEKDSSGLVSKLKG